MSEGRRAFSPVAALLRLLGFLAAIQLALLALALRSGHAELSQTMMDLGAHLMRRSEGRDGTRRLFLNGIGLRIVSGSSRSRVSGLLDRFQAGCRQNDGRLADQIAALLRRGRAGLPEGRFGLPDGTLRHQTRERGFVACLDLGRDALVPREILGRVNRFLRSGDLSALGGLRYLMAEQSEKGASFVAFWTEGETDLLGALPAERDAPGRDVAAVAPPPDSIRVLSAWEQDRAPSLAIYRTSSLERAELERFYRRILPEQGWRLGQGRQTADAAAGSALFAERQGRTVVISFVAADAAYRYVTVSEMN